MKKRSMCQKFLANWHTVLSLDHSMRLSFGFGLAALKPARRMQPPREGEKRRLIPISSLPPAVAAASGKRLKPSFLEHEGRSRLEAAWSGERNLAHSMLGCGSIGWPAKGWLASVPGCRLVRWLDPPHRRSNNVQGALCSAQMLSIRAEALVLVNSSAGPWGGELCGVRGVWAGVVGVCHHRRPHVPGHVSLHCP